MSVSDLHLVACNRGLGLVLAASSRIGVRRRDLWVLSVAFTGYGRVDLPE